MTGPQFDEILKELERFIGMTTEVGPDGYGRPTTHGSQESLLAELALIDPILNRYPEWAHECPQSTISRWRQRREAAIRCVAKIQSRERLAQMLGQEGPELAASSMHPWVWDAARPQWESGHYGEAVGAAARLVNSRLQDKVVRRDISDSALVRETFSLDAAMTGRPRLRVAAPDGSESYRSLQQGVGSFGAGCIQAIRNPVAHDPEVAPEMEEQLALERLAAFSAFARWVDSATLETA